MILPGLEHYREVYCYDFEFYSPDGELPKPLVLVAKEVRTGRVLRFDAGRLGRLKCAPFPTGADTLSVMFFASAECQCFRALGWEQPARIVDLFVEFKNHVNGLATRDGYGLADALKYFGIPTMDPERKAHFRGVAMRGEPLSADEWQGLTHYCEDDVLDDTAGPL